MVPRLERLTASLAPPLNGQDSVYLANFELDGNGDAVFNDGGVYNTSSLNILPAGDVIGSAVPITQDSPVIGELSNDQPFISYVYAAQANEIISVEMNAISGSLDTLLQVVDSNGNILDVNDDTIGSTNSLIANLQLLTDGDYTIVATRYWKEFGGTEGEYQLSVSGATAEQLTSEALNLNLPDGDIEVSILWDTNADLQLLVRDPIGDAVFDDAPRINSGGILQSSGNVNCTGNVDGGVRPVSYIYWPPGLQRPGTYEVEVWYQNDCSDTRPVEFTLTIVVNERVIFVDRQLPLPNQRYVTNFTIEPSGNVVAGQGGFIGNSETLNYQSELTSATQITSGQTLTGIISPTNTFDLYTFEANAGDSVTIRLGATSQALDTKLFLISPSGVEIAENDDADPALIGGTGRTTDSLISGLILPEDGEYLIIASRFGTVFGGTVGAYSVSLTSN